MKEKDTEQDAIQDSVEDSIKDGAKKVEKAGKTALDIGMIVGEALSGNWASAVMRSTKYLGKILLVILIIVLILAATAYTIWFSVAEEMQEMLDKVLEYKNTFIEKMIDIVDVNDTNKWINIDEKLEVEDPNTGTMKQMTLVDYYIERIESLGLSVKALKLLGEADYTSEAVMNDPDNKEKIQKYIKEFVRADIITQEIHRRDPLWGDENAVVNSKDENKIDGGVFLYRTTREDENNLVLNKNKNKYRMTFKTYEEFLKKVTGNQESPDALSVGITVEKIADKKINEIESIYTIDPDTDELLYYKVDTEQYTKKEYKIGTTEEYKNMTVTLQRHDYKKDIAKYALPYEFLINLCNTTQNPEFAYHVAYMARNTRIELLIQDSIATTKTINSTSGDIKEVITTFHYGSSGSDTQSGDPTIDDLGYEEDIIWSEKIVATTTSQLVIAKVDSWSYAFETAYENKFETLLDNKIIDKFYEGKVNLTYSYSTDIYGGNADGSPIGYDDHSFYGENCWTTVTETQTENKFYPTIIVDEIKKSKQFLGLLKNSTGTCSEDDCFENPESVKNCIKNAEFDSSIEGINVAYKIPNSTGQSTPMNKLFGAKNAFLSFFKQIDEDRFQGIIEYMKYIFTLPENEEIQFLDDEIDNIIGNGNNEEEEEEQNYIPQYTWNGTTSELIEMLGKYAHQDMQESGILASVTIAQALIESGWGKSELSATYNNYFGVKKGKGWNGPTVTMPTREVINGKTIIVKAEFRVYNSPLESLKNHSKVLSNAIYAGVKGEKDYRKAITIIKKGGYATDPNYVDVICKVIEQYGLTRFDS